MTKYIIPKRLIDIYFQREFEDVESIDVIAQELSGKSDELETWIKLLYEAIHRGDLKYTPVVVYGMIELTHFVSREDFRAWWLTYNPQQSLPDFWFESEEECHKPANVRGAIRQHAPRNEWYNSATRKARAKWLEGSGLRHDQMAQELMKDAPEKISQKTLLKKLSDVLQDLGRTDLIRGYKKK